MFETVLRRRVQGTALFRKVWLRLPSERKGWTGYPMRIRFFYGKYGFRALYLERRDILKNFNKTSTDPDPVKYGPDPDPCPTNFGLSAPIFYVLLLIFPTFTILKTFSNSFSSFSHLFLSPFFVVIIIQIFCPLFGR